MKKILRKMLAIGVIVLILGSVMFGAVSCSSHKVTKAYEAESGFVNITILSGKEANISLEPSPDDKVRVVAVTHEKVNCTVTTDGTTLFVDIEDTRNWFGRLFEFHVPSLTIYVPEGEYGHLDINNTTGKTNVSSAFLFDSITIDGTTGNITCNASAKDYIHINNTTGDVSLNGVRANTLNVNVSTGNIALSDVITSGKMTIQATTGNISFNRCDAGEIKAKASTGNITGSLLSDKIFWTSSSTGKITVPHTSTGGVCDLSTSTGKINITIE